MSQTRTVGSRFHEADPAMKETTATLEDVAAAAAERLANREASDFGAPHRAVLSSYDRHHGGTTSSSVGGFFLQPHSAGVSAATADAHMQDATDLLLHASTQHQQRHVPTQHAAATTASLLVEHHASSSSEDAAAAHPSAAPAVVSLSMSSIGFGIDPSMTVLNDATEAAYRAVRDAMQRSAVRLPPARQHLSIHLKIGVPPKPSCPDQPMDVDTARLTSLLPRSVPLQPVQVVVGGLLIGNHNNDDNDNSEGDNQHRNDDAKILQQNCYSGEDALHPTICTAVACVTLEQAADSNQSTTMDVNGEHVVVPAPSPWTEHHTLGLGGLMAMSQQAAAAATHHHSSLGAPPTNSMQPATLALSVSSYRQTRKPSTSSVSVDDSKSSVNNSATVIGCPNTSQVMHHSSSMEMLAMISGEIRERQMSGGGDVGTPAGANNSKRTTDGPPQLAAQGSDVSGDGFNANSGYNYKKLPPGVTPKNNRRLFVKHQYRDYSQDEPLPEELFLVRSQIEATRTPNAAFPLKLHETLTQIEQDGNGHIIGWLLHGRSFKIHEQKKFVEIVLPKYFVMTKKSSFLRQLNLYGFNRLSGVGPDQGSYYHEKFLRGLKFLCRRMSRQKVNGNGIRAAGNPDEEPVLFRFPSCPPPSRGGPQLAGKASINGVGIDEVDDCSVPNQKAIEDRVDSEGNESCGGIYCQIVSSPSSRPYSRIVNQLEPKGSKDSDDYGDEGSNYSNDNNDDADSRESPAKMKYGNSARKSCPTGMNSFPLKLQRLLDKAEAEGDSEIISWLPHGRAFLVHDTDKFVSTIMPVYFNQTKYSSFQRQLHMYNFQRITAGPDKGAYHHPYCQRGQPNLCYHMTRTRVNGKGCRRPGNPDKEPDLYAMEYLPHIPRGTFIEIPMAGNADEDADTAVSWDEV